MFDLQLLSRHLCCASLIVAAALSASAAQAGGNQPRPFKADLTTQETLGFNPVACPGTVLQGTTTATGNASHLGSVTLRSTDCIVQDAAQITFNGGMLVVTAANGDTLTANYSGMLLPGGTDPVYTLSGSFSVTGGTGSFSGASGSGTLQGSSNLVSGKGSYSATGTIQY
jgi:hypothetical protein